jgi:hypothetical protein
MATKFCRFAADGDLSRFMQYVAGNIAREVQHLVPEWQGLGAYRCHPAAAHCRRTPADWPIAAKPPSLGAFL